MFRHRLCSSAERTADADVTQTNLKHDNPSFLKGKKGGLSLIRTVFICSKFGFKCMEKCLIILGTSSSQGSSHSSVGTTSCLTLDKERRVRARETSQNKTSVDVIQPS